MWLPERMIKYAKESEKQVLISTVEQDKAEFFLANRGIEQHRLKWLLENPVECVHPCLMMRLQRFEHGLPVTWDLMIDGHHRYVALAMMGMPVFKLYHFTEEEARDFEVIGFPQPRGPMNIDAFSGLGLDKL